jgi:hypothetical protein
VLLNRSEDSNAYLRENLLSVYRLHEGTVQNLVGKDENGSVIVDSIDLSETMQNIYDEYNQLNSL